MSLAKDAAKMVSSAVVQMVFDNTQFDKKIKESIESLNNLNKSLKLDDSVKAANKSLSSINTIDLSSISSGIASLEKRFSTFGIVGMEVIQRITNSVLNMGAQLKAITFGKIFQGGKNRAMNIEQARFMLQGMIDDQNEIKAIEENAKESVNDTAYTFDAAAKAAAQFAATGMRGGEQMAHALSGITGAAAMTNSEYEDMSRIFTTVAGNGKLMGDQLMQFSSRGMNVAANMKDYFNDVNSGAKEASDSVKEAIKSLTSGRQITEGEFREMVSKGKISFEIFAESMYQLYGEHAKKANETLTGVIANTGSALSKMGQLFYEPLVKQNGPLVKFFQAIKDNIVEIRSLMDPIMKSLGNNLAVTIGKLAKVVDKLDFTKLGESASIFTTSITRAFDAVWKIGKSISSIFSLFGNTIKEYREWSKDFWESDPLIERIADKFQHAAKAVDAFVKNSKNMERLKSIFMGVFHAIDLIGEVLWYVKVALSPIAGLFKDLADAVFSGAAALGDWITGIDESNDAHHKMFVVATAIKEALEIGIDKLKHYKDVVAGVVKSIKEWFETKTDIKDFFKNMRDGIEEVDQKLSPLKQLIDFVKKALKGLWQSIKVTLGPLLEGVGGALKGAFGVLMEAIRDIFSGKGFESVLALVNSSIFTAAYAKLFKLFDLFVKSMKGDTVQKSWADRMGFSAPLKALTSTLKEMQSDLKAGVLQKLAVAIGVIAGSLILLSQIETSKLRMAVMTVSMLVVVLVGALKVLEGGAFEGFKDSLFGLAKGLSTKMIGDAAMKFAIAIGILAVAMKILTTMSWEDIGKGLLVVTVLVAEVVAAMKLIPNDFGFKGISLIGFGLSMLALAGVLKILATMNMDQVGAALLAMGGALGEMVIALKFLSSGPALKGSAAIFIVMPAILVLAGALKMLGTMNMDQIGGALLVMGGALGELFIALRLMSESKVLKGAAAMDVVMPAILVLAGCLRLLGTMSIEQALTAFVALGGSLEVLSMMLIAMGKKSEGMIKGAAASLLLIPIMLTLTSMLKTLGAMDIGSVGTALVGLGGSLLAFGYFIESMRGIKLEQMGAMATMAGVISSIANSLVKLGGMNLEQVCVALVALAGAMLEFWVLAKVMQTMALPAIEGSAAMFVMAAAILVMSTALKSLSGLNLIAIGAGLLALFVAMGALVGAAAIMSKIPGMAAAIFKLGTSLLALSAAVALFGIGMLAFSASMALLVTTGTAGAVALVGIIAVLADGIVKTAPKIREALVAVIGEACIAISEAAPKIAATVLDVITSVLTELGAHIDDIVYQIGMIILGIIDGLAEFIGDHGDELEAAIGNLIVNLLYFAAQALIDLWDWFWGMIGQFFQDIWDAILDFFGVHSPSTLFAELGENLMKGLIEGIKAFGGLVIDVITGLVDGIKSLFDGLIEKSGQVGEAIYDALHEDAGADNMIERKRKEAALQMHQQGVKSADFTDDDQLKYYLRQLERIDAGEITDVNGMDQMFKDYYASLPEEAKKAYSETSSIASEAGKDSANQYNASHYAEIEKSKSQREVQATEYYRPNEAAATEAGSKDAQMYNSNHYAEIAKASSSNTKAAQNYYDPYTDVAKKYGLDSGMFYDKNTASGMDKYSSIVNTSGTNVGKTAATGAKSQQKEFRNVGAQYDLGLAQGIQSSSAQGAVIVAVKKLASRMVTEMKKTLDEHSPSRVSEEIGEFFVLGLRNGIVDTEHVATTAVNNLGQNIVSKMTDSLESTDVEDQFTNIQDAMYKVANLRADDLGMDLNPTISPVLSLDNIQNGMATLDSLFSTDRSIALSQSAYQQWQPDQGSMLDSMNQNNTKIVQAISEIRGDISKLENSMAKMRIFLDSGALVGGIITDVDNSLGNIAFMKRRTGGGM